MDLTATTNVVADAMFEGHQHILVIIHGIRDNGVWAAWLQQELIHEGARIRIIPVRYDWNSSWDFICQRTKDRHAAAWQVAMTLQSIFNDNSHIPVSIICHSNGTKILSTVLEEMPFRFHYIFLAGAICLRTSANRFKVAARRVINFVGVRDLWALIAEALHPHQNEATGVHGFGGDKVHDLFFDFGHDGGVSRDHIRDQILPWLALGAPPTTLAPSPYFPKWLSNPTKKSVAAYLLWRLLSWPVRYLSSLVAQMSK